MLLLVASGSATMETIGATLSGIGTSTRSRTFVAAGGRSANCALIIDSICALSKSPTTTIAIRSGRYQSR